MQNQTQKQKYEATKKTYIESLGSKLDKMIISYLHEPSKSKCERLERLEKHYNFIIL